MKHFDLWGLILLKEKDVTNSLLIVGDVHGKFAHLNQLIAMTKCFAVIVVGDFGFWRSSLLYKEENNDTMFLHQRTPFGVPVYFVDGNHEDHNSLEQLVIKHGKNNPIDVGGNCWYVPRGCIFEITNPFTNNKKTILGLGGAYSIDWKQRVPQVSWFEQEQLRYSDIIDLNTDNNVDIIISHTCPERLLRDVANTCQIDYNRIIERQSEKLLDQVFTLIKPKYWFFGHWHQRDTYQVEQTTFELLDMIPHRGCFKLFEV